MCPLVTQEKDEEKLKSSLKDKGMWKNTGDCREAKANQRMCKCEKKTAKLQSNSCINSTLLGNVGFDTEVVII